MFAAGKACKATFWPTPCTLKQTNGPDCQQRPSFLHPQHLSMGNKQYQSGQKLDARFSKKNPQKNPHENQHREVIFNEEFILAVLSMVDFQKCGFK